MHDTRFSKWFTEDYLKVDACRDEREAFTISSLISRRIPGLGGGVTLDLACGAGRHLPHLGAQQRTIGLDLSPWLLDVARDRHARVPLVRADMRALPFRDAAFTLVANLFTSFGYFADDEQSAHVLREVARVTAPGGWLVLDFLNATHTRRTIVPFEIRHDGGVRVDHQRRIADDGRFMLKTIRIAGAATEFTERVRLFEPQELAAMAADSGLVVRETFGDYDGRPLTARSPRAILFAQRPSSGLRTGHPRHDGEHSQRADT